MENNNDNEHLNDNIKNSSNNDNNNNNDEIKKKINIECIDGNKKIESKNIQYNLPVLRISFIKTINCVKNYIVSIHISELFKNFLNMIENKNYIPNITKNSENINLEKKLKDIEISNDMENILLIQNYKCSKVSSILDEGELITKIPTEVFLLINTNQIKCPIKIIKKIETIQIEYMHYLFNSTISEKFEK
jgi:hypothetical protein